VTLSQVLTGVLLLLLPVTAIDWLVTDSVLPCNIMESIAQQHAANKDTTFSLKMEGPEGVEDMTVGACAWSVSACRTSCFATSVL
jgi:hypothetical protein